MGRALAEPPSRHHGSTSHHGGSVADSLQTVAVTNVVHLWQGLQSSLVQIVFWRKHRAEETSAVLESKVDDNSAADCSGSTISADVREPSSVLQRAQTDRGNNKSVEISTPCPIESFLGPLSTPQQREGCAGTTSTVAAVAVTEKGWQPTPACPTSASSSADGFWTARLPNFTAESGHCFPADWLLQTLNQCAQPLEHGLSQWSIVAREHIPVPCLEVTRRSALRCDVRWHGMSWPSRPVAPLERVLTNL